MISFDHFKEYFKTVVTAGKSIQNIEKAMKIQFDGSDTVAFFDKAHRIFADLLDITNRGRRSEFYECFWDYVYYYIVGNNEKQAFIYVKEEEKFDTLEDFYDYWTARK